MPYADVLQVSQAINLLLEGPGAPELKELGMTSGETRFIADRASKNPLLSDAILRVAAGLPASMESINAWREEAEKHGGKTARIYMLVRPSPGQIAAAAIVDHLLMAEKLSTADQKAMEKKAAKTAKYDKKYLEVTTQPEPHKGRYLGHVTFEWKEGPDKGAKRSMPVSLPEAAKLSVKGGKLHVTPKAGEGYFWGSDEGPAKPPREEQLGAVKNGLAQAIEAGKLNGSVDEHVEIAAKFLDRHAKDLDANLADLEALAGPDASVKGRVKTLDSALGKLVRKPKYGTADKLQDGTGMRVIHDSVDAVKKTVEAIKKKYKVVAEDDYISKPNGDYRSHHLIIETPDGLQKEIQVRTKNQNTFADWSHNVYKPLTKAQEEAILSSGGSINEYSARMSDYFWKVDNGQKSDPPPCPTVVRDNFGCIE